MLKRTLYKAIWYTKKDRAGEYNTVDAYIVGDSLADVVEAAEEMAPVNRRNAQRSPDTVTLWGDVTVID